MVGSQGVAILCEDQVTSTVVALYAAGYAILAAAHDLKTIASVAVPQF